MFTGFSLSGGIFLLSIIVFIIFVCRNYKQRFQEDRGDSQLFVLGVLYLSAIIITICGQSITWGVGVYHGLITNSFEYIYSYKAFTYMRYMGSYVPIFIMVALVISWNNWNILCKACKIMPISFIPLFLYWYTFILPYVENTKSNMEFFISIISLPYDANNSITTWYIMFIMLFWMVFLWMFVSNRNLFLIKVLIIGVLFTSYERMTIFNNKILIAEYKILNRVDEGSNVMLNLHDMIIEDDLDICVVEGQDKTDNQIWYIYQFINYDVHIIPGTREELTETEIIFSNKILEGYVSDEYTGFELDKNEYVYSRNNEYTSAISAMGYDEILN